MLDEPTNHLDIQHQLEILTLVRRLPATVVVALHDLNLAALFCDTVAVLDSGRLVATGPPEAVLTEDRILSVFGVRAHVSRSPHHGRLHIESGLARYGAADRIAAPGERPAALRVGGDWRIIMSYLYPTLGAAIAVAGLDKLVGQRGYERMFGDLDWSEGEMRAVAAAEVAGGLMMVPRQTRTIGGLLAAAASGAVLASELRHRDLDLAVPRALVLLAALSVLVARE